MENKKYSREAVGLMCIISEEILCILLKLLGVINTSWLTTLLLPIGIGLAVTNIIVIILFIITIVAYIMALFIKKGKK